jgi:Neprosin
MIEDGHVSISRRGYLAAGLTAAVIGSFGVVSILNANADDAPSAPPAAAASDDSDTTADQAPPSLLPWGERPERLRRGRGGASSAQVAAAGDDIAPRDNSGSLTPRPEWAPKGRYNKGNGLRQESTSVEPPTPPLTGALTEPVNADNPVNFFYAVGSQIGSSDGAYANLEISVQSADGQQIVEVGWTVDRTVNGDDDPHLFVYHWVDRVPSCYNACGWVQYSKTTTPGDTMPKDVTRRFGIQHANGGWWVAYDTEWIGYFPDALWNGTYTRSGVQQFFGEVASSSTKPCSQMGNGLDANREAGAARIGSVTQLNGPDPSVAVRTFGPDTKTSSPYPALALSSRTFRFGGPGLC